MLDGENKLPRSAVVARSMNLEPDFEIKAASCDMVSLEEDCDRLSLRA